MNKIERLTAEQEQAMADFREKWLSIGLSTERADKATAERVLSGFYARIGEKPPQFWHCDSPMQAQLIMNLLERTLDANLERTLVDDLERALGENMRNSMERTLRHSMERGMRGTMKLDLWDTLERALDTMKENLEESLEESLEEKNLKHHTTYLWGAWDSPWIAFYLFPHKHIRALYRDEDAALLAEWETLAKSCLWVYPFKGICFVCDRPSKIKKDDAGRLHCEDGPALEFIDTYAVYAWHGTNIPANWIESPESLTPSVALTHENIEQRRAACEILGWQTNE